MRTTRAQRTGNSPKSIRRLTHDEGIVPATEAAMIVWKRVDQRETALASTASATRTMKKQPHTMYPRKPVLPSVPEPTGNPPAKLTEAMS